MVVIGKTLTCKIFDDFSYQKGGGSGYCQSVMCSLGGRIECKSKLGEFTAFHLYFPVVSETLRALGCESWYEDNKRKN